MKSVMIAAALCVAMVASAPAAVQAAALTKLTDHDIYCTFMPLTSKCAPAKPAAGKPAPKAAVAKPAAKPAPVKVASVKPVKAPHLKMMVCTKRTDGKPYLMSCSWK